MAPGLSPCPRQGLPHTPGHCLDSRSSPPKVLRDTADSSAWRTTRITPRSACRSPGPYEPAAAPGQGAEHPEGTHPSVPLVSTSCPAPSDRLTQVKHLCATHAVSRASNVQPVCNTRGVPRDPCVMHTVCAAYPVYSVTPVACNAPRTLQGDGFAVAFPCATQASPAGFAIFPRLQTPVCEILLLLL